MFKFTKEAVNAIEKLLLNSINSKDFKEAIPLLEKLLNIEMKDNNFDTEYGNKINKNLPASSQDWDMKELCQVESCLAKLYCLKNGPSEEILELNDYYKDIGFNRWWRTDEEIIKLRRIQRELNEKVNKWINDKNINIDENGLVPFSKTVENPDAYEGCQNYFSDYVRTYQYRNGIGAHVESRADLVLVTKRIKSLFVVYMDQCLKNKEIIEEAALDTMMDYKEYAEECMKKKDANFEKQFMKLSWSDDNKQGVGKSNCVKFVGEAGAGKTTQMLKYYWEEIENIINNGKKVFPVWININEISKEGLETEIKNVLGKNGEYMEELLEKRRISLYLDGYNEAIVPIYSDSRAEDKKQLASKIDSYHKNYPELRIFMTDRKEKSNPACLTDDVKVLKFKGMTEEETKSYCSKYLEGKELERMKQYLESKDSDWLYNKTIIPLMLNMLIEIGKEKREREFPKNGTEFYTLYLQTVFIREEKIKKEMRIDILRDCLAVLAENMANQGIEEVSGFTIRTLWQKALSQSRSEVDSLLRLALELPILEEGIENGKYRFLYDDYYVHFLNLAMQ